MILIIFFIYGIQDGLHPYELKKGACYFWIKIQENKWTGVSRQKGITHCDEGMVHGC